MMALSHSSTTAALSFNPYLPLPGRLLEVLLSAAALGTAIQTCNRTLAQLAHCSAGAIPAALRTLEADGYIERVTTSHGSLIVVSERSGITDRSPTTHASDQDMADRCRIAASSSLSATPDRPDERSAQRSAMPDPPLHPPVWKQHDSQEQQQPHTYANPRLEAALQAAGAEAPVIRDILQHCPERTPEELRHALSLASRRQAQGRVTSAQGLVFGLWRQGKRLVEELCYEPRTGDTGDHRAHLPRPGASGNGRGALARGGTTRRAAGSAQKHDRYGAGAAYRERPAESDLPPFLRQAHARTAASRASALPGV
jgi:hypothetical protein